MVDPTDVATSRRLMEAAGNNIVQCWSPDGSQIAAIEFRFGRREQAVLLIDIASRRVVTLPAAPQPFTTRFPIRWPGDGRALYWGTSRGSDLVRLATYELATGRETSLTDSIPWNVQSFDVSSDGRVIAFAVNEDGWSRVYIFDVPSGKLRPAPGLAKGVIPEIIFRPRSQEFAFSWSGAHGTRGLYSYDIESGRQTTWVVSTPWNEAVSALPEPRLIRYPTFDGQRIPALVRPAAPKFSGPRPVLIVVHGGPSEQARPTPVQAWDFLACELGIVVIEPNVRGSSGFGPKYSALDDRERREDAVRDIGALIDWA